MGRENSEAQEWERGAIWVGVAPADTDQVTKRIARMGGTSGALTLLYGQGLRKTTAATQRTGTETVLLRGRQCMWSWTWTRRQSPLLWTAQTLGLHTITSLSKSLLSQQ